MGNRQKRYPSIRAFQKQEARLFIGRDQEIKLLYNKVVSEKMVLLFARSGIGKSSLINAGLIPMLEDRGFLPLDIRLTSSDDPTDTPLLIFKKLLVHYLDKDKYDSLVADVHAIFPEYQPGLWEYFKCCTFPLATTPVLIFDQFEQFFSFSVPEQDEFMEQFGNIIADSPPAECIDWLHDLAGTELREKYASFLSQPDLHVLFAIRSDKIFEMNRLSQIVSNILRNRFELYPLKEEEAKKAISVPAAAKNTFLYQSHSFSYDPALIDNIILRLKGGNDIIETTQLQIICSEIENRIILGPDGEPDKPEGYEVTETDLRNIGGIENIVSHFYQNQVKKMGDEKHQELARILIEDNLFDKDARNRKLAFKEAVVNILNQGKDKLEIKELDAEQFINKLLGLRLIREDYRENKKFYEISHDYLLNAITESFETREAKRLAEANAELERNYENLRKLKEKAEKAEETARLKQEEAEKASQEALHQQQLAIAARDKADKNYELAISERRKVEKLKRRNERLGMAFFIIGVAGIIYLLYNYNRTYENKVKFKTLSEKTSRFVFNSEAERRFAAGDRLVAYALWDSARKNFTEPGSEDDTMLLNRLTKQQFPPFSGMTIRVSKDLHYVVTKYSNQQLLLWKVNEDKNEVENLLNLNNLLDFEMLPDGRIILTDTTRQAFSFDPEKDKVPKPLFNDSIKISDIIQVTESNLLILTDTGDLQRFYRTEDHLQPIEPLNAWYKEQRDQERKKHGDIIPAVTFTGINNNFFLVEGFDNVTYSCNTTGAPLPVKLSLPEDAEFVIARSDGKIAYNDGYFLKIIDLATRTIEKIRDPGMPLDFSNEPVAFFDNGNLLLIKCDKSSTESGFVIYDMLQKKISFARSTYKELEFGGNYIGFTNKGDSLILYNVVQQRVVYPIYNTGQLILPPVKLFSIYENSKLIYASGKDGSLQLFTPLPNGDIVASLVKGKIPYDVYGNKFREYFDVRTRKYTLEFQDTAKNNVQNLRDMFRKYIDREIKEATED
jgi:hypothetical protein